MLVGSPFSPGQGRCNSCVLVYAIEATVHAPSFEGVYGEIFKILKPGGVVCDYLFPDR
jgi:sterol 24-C-methyltransferase